MMKAAGIARIDQYVFLRYIMRVRRRRGVNKTHSCRGSRGCYTGQDYTDILTDALEEAGR